MAVRVQERGGVPDTDRACVDLGAAAFSDGDARSLLVAFYFGNRCRRPISFDLAQAAVEARTTDGRRIALERSDPRHEVTPLTLDRAAYGSELVRYRHVEAIGTPREVCICLAPRASGAVEDCASAPLCFDPSQAPPVARSALGRGWFDPRSRGETLRSKDCSRSVWATENHVVGESVCSSFGEFWSVESTSAFRPRLMIGRSEVPTFRSDWAGPFRMSGRSIPMYEISIGATYDVAGVVYAGAMFGGGMGVGSSRSIEAPPGVERSSVFAMTVLAEPVVGLRLPLGPLALRAETALPLRLMLLTGPTDPATNERVKGSAGSVAIVPRGVLEFLYDARLGVGLYAGADVLHGAGPSLGLLFTFYPRNFGGPYAVW